MSEVVQLFRFVLVGFVNTSVGLLCIWSTMYFLELSVAAANLIGYFIGIFLSYGLNRRWTFALNEPAPHRLNRWI